MTKHKLSKAFIILFLTSILLPFGADAKVIKPLPDFKPELAKSLVEKNGALLLDVRSQAEYNSGNINGSTLIPVGDLGSKMDEIKKLTKGDLNHPIVIYCRSGGRAGKAKKMLEKAGFTQVTNLGGYKDWPKK